VYETARSGLVGLLAPVRPEPMLTVARTVADVLAEHVIFEMKCIDRMYLNVYVPQLAVPGGVGGVRYDLRRLRAHGLITRIPGTHRYQINDTGLHHGMLLTHLHTRILQPGLAQLTDPNPPGPSTLRTAARNYQHALDQLTQDAGFAA